jgi:hypothetical protein
MQDRISISRWHGSNSAQGINITIESGTENKIIYRGDMKLEDFAKCITAQGCIPIETEIK